MPTSKTRYILAGSCIDGSGAPARKDLLLTVQDGIITAINGRTDLPKQNGADIDDLSHCTLVPPLVDCNLALTRSPSMQPRQGAASAGIDLNEQIAQMQRHIRYLHDHGVLGAVDNDAKASLIVGLRARDAENALISLRSPHDPHTSFAWRQISPEITPPPQRNSEAVRDRHPQEKQQNRDKKLVVLANGPEQVTRALDEGCDAVVQGYGMGERNLRRMAAERVLWIPSLILAKNGLDSSGSGGDVCCRFSLSYVAPGQAQPGAKGYWQQLLAEQLEQLRLARELGFPPQRAPGPALPASSTANRWSRRSSSSSRPAFPLRRPFTPPPRQEPVFSPWRESVLSRSTARRPFSSPAAPPTSCRGNSPTWRISTSTAFPARPTAKTRSRWCTNNAFSKKGKLLFDPIPSLDKVFLIETKRLHCSRDLAEDLGQLLELIRFGNGGRKPVFLIICQHWIARVSA